MECQFCGNPLGEDDVQSINSTPLDSLDEGENVQSALRVSRTSFCGTCGTTTKEDQEIKTEFVAYDDNKHYERID